MLQRDEKCLLFFAAWDCKALKVMSSPVLKSPKRSKQSLAIDRKSPTSISLLSSFLVNLAAPATYTGLSLSTTYASNFTELLYFGKLSDIETTLNELF